jgi:hypothetical protein
MSAKVSDDIAVFLARFGNPTSEEGRRELASHFRAEARRLQTKVAELEDAAHLLDKGYFLAVDPPGGQFSNWPSLGELTIEGTRLAESARGFEAPTLPLNEVKDSVRVEGCLSAFLDDRGANISWWEPWQAEAYSFAFRPLTEKDGRRMYAFLCHVGKALIAAGKLRDYHARVPEGAICNACGEQPVRPPRGQMVPDSIRNYRGVDMCHLCRPILEGAFAQALPEVSLWNGHVIKLQHTLTEEQLEQVLDKL